MATKIVVVATLLASALVFTECSSIVSTLERNIPTGDKHSRGSTGNLGFVAGNYRSGTGFPSQYSSNSQTNTNRRGNRRGSRTQLFEPFSFGLGFLSNSRKFSDVNFPFNLDFSESGMNSIQDTLNETFGRRFARTESRRIRDRMRGLSLSGLRDGQFDPVSFGLGFSSNFDFSEGSNLTEIFAGRTMQDMKAAFRTQFGTSGGDLNFRGFKRGFSKFGRGGRFGFQNGSIFFRGGRGRTVGGRRPSGSFVGFGRGGAGRGRRGGLSLNSGFNGFGSFGNGRGRENGSSRSHGNKRNRSRGRFGGRSFGFSRGGKGRSY